MEIEIQTLVRFRIRTRTHYPGPESLTAPSTFSPSPLKLSHSSPRPIEFLGCQLSKPVCDLYTAYNRGRERPIAQDPLSTQKYQRITGPRITNSETYRNIINQQPLTVHMFHPWTKDMYTHAYTSTSRTVQSSRNCIATHIRIPSQVIATLIPWKWRGPEGSVSDPWIAREATN